MDYVIIGGGLAGSFLAYLLQKNNYHVLLVEKQKLETKFKLCGGILPNKSYDLLLEYFPKEEIDSLIESEFHSCKLFSKEMLDFDEICVRVVERQNLDQYVLKQYQKLGGKVLDGVKEEILDTLQNLIIIDGKSYHYDFLIGADGVMSFVRKNVTGRFQKRNFALECFGNKKMEDLILEFENGYYGYHWVIPLKEKVCIGTGNFKGDVQLDSYFEDLCKRYGIEEYTKKGAFLPTGDDIVLRKDNVFFVGDAAGLISPITGEGIYYALLSSKVLFDCFHQGHDYEEKLDVILKKIKKELSLSKYVYQSMIRNKAFRFLKNNSKEAKKLKKKIINTIL